MRYIKKFEDLNFSGSILATTRDFLNMYYQCENCNDIFKLLNKDLEKCPNCKCPDPKKLTEDEYYEIRKFRGENEIDLNKERIEDREDIIDMPSLFDRGKNKKYYN